VGAQKTFLFRKNTLYVTFGTNDLKPLSFFYTLARTSIQENDIAFSKRALFRLSFGSHDLGRRRKALVFDITRAVQVCNSGYFGSTSNGRYHGRTRLLFGLGGCKRDNSPHQK